MRIVAVYQKLPRRQNLTARRCHDNRTRPMLLGWAAPGGGRRGRSSRGPRREPRLRGRPGVSRPSATAPATRTHAVGVRPHPRRAGRALASVWALRDDLTPAASGHFTVGTAIVVLFSAAALVSRRIAVDERARVIHPWIGAAALLLCGVQVFLGLQIMPH